MTSISISLAQMHIQVGNRQQNYDRARQMIQEAAYEGCHLVLLPELWNTGYDLPNCAAHAAANQELIPELSSLSTDLNIIIGGSMLFAERNNVFNTFFLFQPGSQPPITYHKIHLFRQFEEGQWLNQGNEPVSVDLPWAKTGLSVCYDLRFPELFRQYTLQGDNLILLCAEWSIKRVEHWQTLLRARAIENQLFFAATNAVGESGGETFGGSSAVFSPWGDALVQASQNEEELLIAEVEMEQIVEVRKKLTLLDDRRPDVYGNLTATS